MLPHAPILVDVPSRFRTELDHVRFAAFELQLPRADVAVVISPHGATAGIYESGTGDLRAFGRTYAADFESSCGFKRHPEAEEQLARVWGAAPLAGGMDHGLVVPCELGGVLLEVPVIPCALPEVTGPMGSDMATLHRAAGELFGAIDELARRYRVLVAASAHLGAASTERAPAGHRPGTGALDEIFMETFESDVGGTTAVLDRLASDTDSCGWGPLNVLAALMRDRPGTIHGYVRPLGVGYLVASVMAAGEVPAEFGPARVVITPPVRRRGRLWKRRGRRA